MKFVNSSVKHPFAAYPYLSISKLKRAFLTYPRRFFLRAVIPLAFIFSLSNQSTLAQDDPEYPVSPSTAWNLQFVDASPYIDKMTNRSLAFRPYYGTPCVAFGGDKLYYSCYQKDPVTKIYKWTTTIVDASTRVGIYAALAFNRDYNPFISYYDAENGKLKLAYYDGGAWQVLFVPDHPAVPTKSEEDIEPVEESSDQPVRETFEERIKTILQPWLEPLVSPDSDVQSPSFDYDEGKVVGKYTSIDVDYLNRIHITYLDDVDSSFWYVRYSGGSSWDFVLVDYYPDRKRVGLWSSIVVDEDLGVHMSYMSEKYDSLKYAYLKTTNWNLKKCTVDGKAKGDFFNYNDTGAFTSIALDSDGIPHISYYDFSNGFLKHAWLAQEECYEGPNRINYNRGWKTETVDSSDMAGWYTSITISGADDIFISYYDAGERELKYAHKNGSWSKKTLHSSWGNNGRLTSIAISGGRPGIFYFNAQYGLVQFTRCTSGCTNPSKSKWDGPSTVYDAEFRDVGPSTSIAVKSTGVPYISYLDASSGYQKYALSLGSSWWKTPLLTSSHAGTFSSIQLYGDTYPRIAFYDHQHKDLMWAKYTTSGWHFTRVDESYDVGQYVSMALDSTGLPHISYYDATNTNLIYAYWKVSSSKWVTDTLDKSGDVGMYTSIALDSSDKPYISYYDATHESLKYAFKTNIDAWKTVTVDDDPSGDIVLGLYTSIIVKGSYQPFITYYDKTNGDLKYAYSTDPNGEIWDIGYVHKSSYDVGMYSSLKWYATDDSLHVCYYDATMKDLMYARGIGAGPITWTRERVDQTGDVGAYCSMGLDSIGRRAISYYDNSNGDLKIALDYTLPPAAAQLFLPLMYRRP